MLNFRRKVLLFALALNSTIAFAAPEATSNYTVLKGASIIDMTDERARIGDMLIRDDVIEKVSFGSEITPPKGSVVYDFTDKYIIPGLIDNHVHITHGTYDEALKELNTALKNGVTGVREMGGDGRMLSQLKRTTLIGENIGSDVYFSAIVAGKSFFELDPRPSQVALGAEVGNVPWLWAVDENSNFENMFTQTKGLGASAIKIYSRVDKNTLNKAVIAAKKQGLQVWSHASVAPTRPSDILNAGVDVVSHAGDFIQYELVNEVKDRYTFKTPEDNKKYRQQMAEIPFSADDAKVQALFKAMNKHGTSLDATLWVYSGIKSDEKVLSNAKQATLMAYQAGVKIAAGTDQLIHNNGYVSNIHSELRLLVDAGLSNIDALRAATIVNAEGLGEANNLGTLEQGKLANLVVLNANPLENIDNTRTVFKVMKRGSIHDGFSSISIVEPVK